MWIIVTVHLPVNIDHFGDREAAVWETSPLFILNLNDLTLAKMGVKSVLSELKKSGLRAT